MPTGKYRALAQNAAMISVGTLLSKLVVFLMVRFYTGVLSPAEYGTGDLLITTVSLLTPFVSFGISDGVFRFAPEYPRARRSIFTGGVLAVTGGTVLLTAFLPVLSRVRAFQGYAALLVLMTAASCCHSVCEQYVRACGDTALYALQGLLNTLLVVTLNILLLTVFRMGVAGYVLSVALADLLCTAFLIWRRRLWRLLTLRPNRRLLRRMLRYSIPMIPTTVFWWITSASDRYMIAGMLGSEANGIYTLANKLPTVLTLLSGVVMQAWQYSAVRESKSDLSEQVLFYSNVWLALLTALSLVAGVMIALAKVEIRLLADAAYYAAWREVPVLCAAMLLCAFTSFMGSVYTVTQKSGFSLWTSLLGAGTNIALNALLIPSPLGISGAALATLASYLVVFLVRARNARRWIPFRLFKRTLLLDAAVLTVQILFIRFAWPGWQLVQLAAVAALLLVGRKQLLLTLRRRKSRAD